MRKKYLTKPEKLNQYPFSLSQIVRPLKIKMNLISSIHDTPIDAIVETHHQSEVECSKAIHLDLLPELEINIELYSAGFFDGVTGLDAQLPYFKDYWDG